MTSTFQTSAISLPGSPTLISAPRDGQAIDGPLVFKFSEAIQFGNGTLQISGPYSYLGIEYIGVSAQLTIAGDTLVYQPGAALRHASDYRIEILASAIKDLDGNAVEGRVLSFAFRTGVSAVALDLKGTLANERFDGSDLDDIIDGDGGGDVIYGYGGDDLLVGDDGADTPRNSNDALFGGEGNDTLHGGHGDDELDGGSGNDKLYGGSGWDTLEGGAGDDLLEGGEGNDTLSDSQGHNHLRGGDGGDTLRAASPLASGILDGGAHNDRLIGFGGLTYLGGDGADHITVEFTASNDRATTVDAGSGDDLIELTLAGNATGKASLTGGAGSDTWSLRSTGASGAGPQATILDFTPGAGGDLLDIATLVPAIGNANPFDSGKLRFIAAGADTVLQLQRASGSGFIDLVTLRGVTPGQIGAANIVGGHDPLGAAAGVTLTGTSLKDILRADARDTTLLGLDGDDELYGGNGNDTLDGGNGDDTLDGGKGDNTLRGGSGNDRLLGGAGNDTLLGGAGRDTLTVSASLDGPARTLVLDGGDGDDVLALRNLAGAASVRASGGEGADRFVLADGGRDVTIADLGAGDLIDLSALLPATLQGNPFGAAGYLKASQLGADVLLQFDRDGAAGSAHGLERLALLANQTLATLNGNSFVGGFDPKGGNSGVTVTGTERDDWLTGTVFDDTIAGGDGADLLHGLAGKDLLRGGAGNDKLHGHEGDDTLFGDGGDDELDGGAGNDTLEGGAGSDVLRGGTGVNILRGGDGNDVLSTDDWDSPFAVGTVFDGGAGNDHFDVSWSVGSVTGGSGDDHIDVSGRYTTGVSPALTIDAGEGDDTIVISDHTVTRNIAITGGAGVDDYHFAPARTPVQVTIGDFRAGAGGDVLVLSSLFDAAAGKPFASGHLRLVQDGSRVQLQVRGDGPFATIAVLENAAVAAFSADNFSEGWNPDGSAGGKATEGGAGADKLIGGRLDDVLRGGGGNDDLYGNEGADRLEGGDGVDSALYGGPRAGYLVRKPESMPHWEVGDRRAGAPDGADRVFDVERLLFADGALALDIEGVAGQAYRIYRAAFDRTPDEAGLGFWIDSLDRGASLKTIAGGFIASQEFADLYGSAPGNAEIVARLYRNILDREPEQAGFDYWVEVLETGRTGLADVLADFSESAENVAAVTPLIGQGIAYQPWGG